VKEVDMKASNLEARRKKLQQLDESVVDLNETYKHLSDSGVMVYKLWTAKDVLAHLTFWHESFARNVMDLVNGRKPTPLIGRFKDLNQAGVDSMHSERLEAVMARFNSAHKLIQENILNSGLNLIPYKKGSRDYSPEEHLEIVKGHINKHLRDVKEVSVANQLLHTH
jgi:hypothetical protein